MVQILSGLDLSYVIRQSRTLFRKSIWLKVGAFLSSSKTQADNILDDSNGFRALKRCNWNLVSNSKQSVWNAAHISTPVDDFSAFAVVMISIDATLEENEETTFSDDFIKKCVRDGSIYGKIGNKTHIVVQIFFTGIRSSLGSSVPICNTEEAIRASGVNDAVTTIMIDSFGVGYVYNLPTNHCEGLAYRCVARLMDVAIETKPAKFIKMISYTPRSKHDDYMFSLFLTGSCASESTMSAIMGYQDDRKRCTSLAICRPSKAIARPSRVISNLRFLVFLSNQSNSVVDDLLLDERNSLDSFRRIVMDVNV